ncbi:MAG: thiamine pyrophosphate-dependent dehydrogenase E1 component subunit alpha [Alphaproteobacteria bacterium]|nr:thiamine pyrophosphate-dependent dehydrogenase E1 component subunit alpha [Alphaproteobacteria bacterium]
MMRRMQRIRHFEDKAIELHKNSEIRGSLHTSQGQEGEIVGACTALRIDDYMVGNHRSHGHPIGKGAKLRGLMAELLGRKTGVCQGKGGSMHLADFSVGSLGETSIVGSGIPVAAGAALGAKMQGTDRVSLCFFGDGAAQEGAFHEGVNLAAIWNLPAIFLCENNGYAVSTPIAKSAKVPDIAARAAGYGIPGVIVDGQDAFAVREAVTEAVHRARTGGGPTLVEAKTYRYIDHAANMGRDLGYRTDEEIADWRAKRDPIQLFRDRLLGDFKFSAGEVDALEEEAIAEVEDAVAFARDSALPDAAEAWTDVFAPAA